MTVTARGVFGVDGPAAARAAFAALRGALGAFFAGFAVAEPALARVAFAGAVLRRAVLAAGAFGAAFPAAFLAVFTAGFRFAAAFFAGDFADGELVRLVRAGRVGRVVFFRGLDEPEGLRLGPGLRRAMRSPAPGIDGIPVSDLFLSAYRITR